MDIEKAIQFLLEQQARHESRQRQFEIDVAKINEMLLQTNAHLVQITANQERAGEILATLAERQIKTEDALAELAERQVKTENALAELAGETRTLTSVLERHLADHERP